MCEKISLGQFHSFGWSNSQNEFSAKWMRTAAEEAGLGQKSGGLGGIFRLRCPLDGHSGEDAIKATRGKESGWRHKVKDGTASRVHGTGSPQQSPAHPESWKKRRTAEKLR